MEDVEEELKEVQNSEMYKNISKFFTPKPFTNHSLNKSAKITNYIEVTIYELYQKVL